jgi:Protein of unknown function (DUF3295)
MFQRVDSKPNLVSRRSLLTIQIHENDRASAQYTASHSTPTICGRHKPNSPLGSSPRFAQPSVMTASNNYPLVPSPRSNRRKMLSMELAGSPRENFLWERKVKSSTFNAVKYRHPDHGIKHVQTYPGENGNAYSIHFDAGLRDYHWKRW